TDLVHLGRIVGQISRAGIDKAGARLFRTADGVHIATAYPCGAIVVGRRRTICLLGNARRAFEVRRHRAGVHALRIGDIGGFAVAAVATAEQH
ncbi:hypothetical protein DVW31_16195, partial [Enterococcus faecium]